MNRQTIMCDPAFAAAMGPAFGPDATEGLKAISIPDHVETSTGALNLCNRAPEGGSVFAVFNGLPLTRGVRMFLDHAGARLPCTISAEPAEPPAGARIDTAWLALRDRACPGPLTA
jgi:hypothetical protein